MNLRFFSCEPWSTLLTASYSVSLGILLSECVVCVCVCVCVREREREREISERTLDSWQILKSTVLARQNQVIGSCLLIQVTLLLHSADSSRFDSPHLFSAFAFSQHHEKEVIVRMRNRFVGGGNPRPKRRGSPALAL